MMFFGNVCAAQRFDESQLKTINNDDGSLDAKTHGSSRYRLHAAVQSPHAMTLSGHKPRLLIVKSGDGCGAVEPSFRVSESRPGIVPVPTVVCRLLGDLLALRCCCEVRIDGDVLTTTTTTNNNNNDIGDSLECDGSYYGLTALVVIHSNPAPVDRVGLENWLSDLYLVKSSSTKWIGLERHFDEKNGKTLAVFHVYFSTFDRPIDIDGCR